MSHNKKNINFSKAEVNFLNNFSSIAELQSFAESFGEVLQKVKDYVNDRETLRNIKDSVKENDWVLPTVGAVGGAGMGALGSLVLGDKKKSKLRRSITGAGIGAGLGLGAGAVGLYAKLKRDIAEEKELSEEYNYLLDQSTHWGNKLLQDYNNLANHYDNLREQYTQLMQNKR